MDHITYRIHRNLIIRGRASHGFVPFHYKIREVTRVIDGDTIRTEIDLGLRTYREASIRIAGIDAPEVYGSNKTNAGTDSQRALEGYLQGKELMMETFKDRKSFDRYIGIIWHQQEDGELEFVSDWMVQQGFAVRSEE